MNKLLITLLFSTTCTFAAQSFAADTGAAHSSKTPDAMTKSQAHVAKKKTHAAAHQRKSVQKKSETPAYAK